MEILRKPIAELRLDPRNAREHGDQNLQAIEASLSRFQQVEPLVVQRGTNKVIGGNGRLVVMRKLGWVEADVVEVDLDDRAATALGLALNQTSALATWDENTLAQLLSDLKDAGELLGTGFAEADVDQILRDLELANAAPVEDPGAQSPPQVPVTRCGDLWVLGGHRLACGDATCEADVRRLLNGERPHLMVTDPPYGVAYDPAWRNEAGLASTERTGRVANDHRCDWSEAWALFPGAVAYVWHAGKFAAEVAQSLAKTGFEVRAQLIWSKPRFAISRGHYHWAHEPAYYAVRDGQSSKWCGDRTQSTVWEVEHATDVDHTDHGTPKPVELFARPIRNHGGPDDHIYEPFAGSGPAIIAAEQLQRRCFALELEPRYCDAIVKRWERATKKQAVLDGDGRTFAKIAAERGVEIRA
jgi:DNA modification methylase